MKKLIILIIFMMSTAFSGIMFTQPVYAACPADDAVNTPINQVKKGVGSTGDDCSGSGVDRFVIAIVKVLSWVVGIAAIIMIIVSGFKYITSGGDAGKVTSAKNTLIYALIGIAVAVLAQLLVNFAFTVSNNAVNPPPPPPPSATNP